MISDSMRRSIALFEKRVKREYAGKFKETAEAPSCMSAQMWVAVS